MESPDVTARPGCHTSSDSRSTKIAEACQRALRPSGRRHGSAAPQSGVIPARRDTLWLWMNRESDRIAWLRTRLRAMVGRRLNEGFRPGSQDRRREPRAALRDTDDTRSRRVYIKFGDFTCRLRDLSAGGLAFVVPVTSDWSPPLGAPLDGILVIEELRIAVRLKPVSQRDDAIGCIVEAADEGWAALVSTIVDPIKLGKGMVEAHPEPELRGPDGLLVRWYKSDPGCDLYVWTKPTGTVVLAQLFFMGHAVEWSMKHGVRVGPAPETTAAAETGVCAPREIAPDETPAATGVLSVAHCVLASAQLPGPLRLFILSACGAGTRPR